jgi:site-specific DNA-methyltransferase (adenine-specific)
MFYTTCYKPLFEREKSNPISEVVRLDNMKFMAAFPDKFFDLAIVDPPYGINVAKLAYTQEDNRPCIQKNGTILNVKKKNYKFGDWDKEPANIDYLIELKRISKHQIIWGINYMDFHLKGGRLVWNKLVPEGVSFSDCEIAYCSMFERVENVYYKWAGMMQGVYCGKNIEKAIIQQGNKQLNEERIHPTHKPKLLYKWCLDKYGKQGQKILDTHLGSQSSRIAAWEMGFDFWGCEIDEQYFNDGCKRFETETMQTALWVG